MSDQSAISAINEVLRAEKENNDRIEHCRHQAEQIIEHARHQVRQISNRADERISIVHARSDLSIHKHVAELRQQMALLPSESQISQQQQEMLHQAIAELVEELVGDNQ